MKRNSFSLLGSRVRQLRKKHGYSQEDMISFGFSARHWQQVEAGPAVTATVCAESESFKRGTSLRTDM